MEKYERKSYSVHTDSAVVRKKRVCTNPK